MILGLDVSLDQGVITPLDWKKLRAQERRFVMDRCEEALEAIDPRFAANAAGAKAGGLARSPYFPWHPDVDPVKQAAAHFKAAGGLGTQPGDLGPSLDVELAEGMERLALLAALAPYVDQMSLLFKRPCIFYSYEWFLAHDLSGPEAQFLSGTLLWLAAYQATPPPPPAPWTRVHFWQRSGGKSYRTPEGCPCDDDVFLGTEEEFAALCDPDAMVVVPTSSETGV